MKKLLSLILCAALALALCIPAAAAFSDVAPNAWYAKAVEYCEANGLMDGLPGGIFNPGGNVNRAQLVTALWRLAGKPAAAGTLRFSDVADGAWYADAVRWAAGSGVTDGMGDGSFQPEASVSREMLATFFYRYAGRPTVVGEEFADQNAISAWAQEATRWAAGTGLMQGVGGGIFDPKSSTTRAALAQTLMNYARHTNQVDDSELYAACMPTGIARGEDGALWITDSFNKAVWRVSGGSAERVAGAVTVKDISGVPMGGYLDGVAKSALFASPWGIAPFLGGWAISDPENNVIRVLMEDVVWTANISGYDYPTGLAADENGLLYVANTHAGEVFSLNEEGKHVVVASGLNEPMGLCWHDGVLYIAETGAHRIRKLDNGLLTTVAGSGEEGSADGKALEASFVSPQGIAVGPDGSIYVSDAADGSVRRVKDGQVTTLLAPPDPMGQENAPMAPVGLLVDGAQLYVCDRFARKILTVALS